MNTQAVLFTKKDGTQYRLPAEATIRELVTVFGVSRIRITDKDTELQEGEGKATLQQCSECGNNVVNTNIHGQCQNCEGKNDEGLTIRRS